MRTTTNWGWSVPNADLDPDAVPTHVGALADAIDAIIVGGNGGTLAALPAAGKNNQLYLVTSGPSLGACFIWQNAQWNKLNPLAAADADIITQAFGDAPSAGTTAVGTAYAPKNHKHGMPANPIIAHLAALDPHTQYLLAANLGAYTETLTDMGNLTGNKTIDLSLGSQFKGRVIAATTILMANPWPTGTRQQFGAYFKQDATGSHAITWPVSYDWGTAGPPAVGTANQGTFVSGFSDDGGASWQMFQGGFGGY